jgi:uncharacterized protein (DUF983 family)
MTEPRSFRLFLTYLARAGRLRCPACGKKPLFTPWFRVRSLRDWFSPLDGCPVCGYPYEREVGYYLMAIWAVNYGVASVLGIAIYLVLEILYDLPLRTLLLAVVLPIFFFNILFARHAKAFFLAVDLFFDPHDRGGDDDGGNKPIEPVPPPSPEKQTRREPALV